MNFIAPIELSASSNSPTDRSISTTRVTGSSESRTTGKSFSNVLQSLRSDPGRNDNREAKVIRTSDRTDERSDAREIKGLRVSPDRVERSDASSKQMVDDNPVKGGEARDVENSEVDLGSSAPSSQAGSGSSEQHATALEPMMAAQVAASMTEQMRHDSREGSLCTNCGDESAEDSGMRHVDSHLTTASSATMVHTTHVHMSEDDRTTPVQEGQTRIQEISVTQTGVEPPVAQRIKPEVPIIDNKIGESVIAQGETHPGMPELKPTSIPLSQNLRATQQGQMDVDQIPSDNQSALAKDVVIQPKHTAPLTLPYGQTQQYTQTLEAHTDLSAMSEVRFAQGQQLNGETTGQSSGWETEQHAQGQGNSETPIYKTSANTLQTMNGQVAEPFAITAPAQTFSTPVTHAHGSLATPVQPSVPTVDLTPHSVGSVIRSVVVDLAQPELGHVNVRVSMMNDSVHAHFSTDRAEVGQFLMNGQDRLQATLQANGLDMGQFRVDIDRHNGGRSFQQGFFQEQGQAWNQGSDGRGKEQGTGRSAEGQLFLQGRLNLVA